MYLARGDPARCPAVPSSASATACPVLIALKLDELGKAGDQSSNFLLAPIYNAPDLIEAKFLLDTLRWRLALHGGWVRELTETRISMGSGVTGSWALGIELDVRRLILRSVEHLLILDEASRGP
jgi:hypothetical protein